MNFIRKYKNLLFSLIVSLSILVVPLSLVQAQTRNYGLDDVSGNFKTGTLSNSDSIPRFIGNIIKILLGIAGAVAVLFVLIGGFQYMTSAGNEKAAEAGKTNIFNALIGIVIIILSYVIVNVVVDLVTR
jgi:hypothetical protein